MSEYIKFKCGSCDKTLKIGVRHAGTKGKCPACGRTVRVPTPTEGLGNTTAAGPRPEVKAEPKPRPPAVKGGSGLVPEEDFGGVGELKRVGSTRKRSRQGVAAASTSALPEKGKRPLEEDVWDDDPFKPDGLAGLGTGGSGGGSPSVFDELLDDPEFSQADAYGATSGSTPFDLPEEPRRETAHTPPKRAERASSVGQLNWKGAGWCLAAAGVAAFIGVFAVLNWDELPEERRASTRRGRQRQFIDDIIYWVTHTVGVEATLVVTALIVIGCLAAAVYTLRRPAEED